MTEKKGDTAVFAFGRFNPPTIGHEKLVIAVANVSRSWGGDFFIYPSHTQDSKKNPLNQATKIKYMKKMFPKFSRNIVASTGKTALEIASEFGVKSVIQPGGSRNDDKVIQAANDLGMSMVLTSVRHFYH